MRRITAVIALVLGLSACTPTQYARYLAAIPVIGQETADQVAADYFAQKAAAIEGRPCAEWYDLAIEAGFTPEQWREPVSRIMWGESRCNPLADSPISSARGLMQHLSWWAPRCGGTYEDLHDPTFSLRCAYKTYQDQGWGAWSAF